MMRNRKKAETADIRKNILRLCVLILLFCAPAVVFTGCGGHREQERTEVDFTVVPPESLPQSLQEQIEQNREKEIRMSWEDGGELYLIRGYGKQSAGGYSVAVAGCTEDDETVWLDTRLIVPPKDTAAKEPSCPYVAVRIDARDKEIIID